MHWACTASRVDCQLQKDKSPGQIPAGFQLAQLIDGLQQGHEQGALHVASADHPGGDAVDAGVEEVHADVDPVQKAAPHDLLHQDLQIIRQGDHMVTVPAHAPADVEHDVGHKGQERRDLVADGLRGVEVAGIETDADLVACWSQSTAVADGCIQIPARALTLPDLSQCFRSRH